MINPYCSMNVDVKCGWFKSYNITQVMSYLCAKDRDVMRKFTTFNFYVQYYVLRGTTY